VFGFKKLKMKKEELEQQNAQLMEALSKTNKANSELSNLLKQTSEKLNQASQVIINLENQIKMLKLQEQSRTRYSDSDRNY
jgi:septal ring factor EnvC (AmiA/AmiB activator)